MLNNIQSMSNTLVLVKRESLLLENIRNVVQRQGLNFRICQNHSKEDYINLTGLSLQEFNDADQVELVLLFY